MAPRGRRALLGCATTVALAVAAAGSPATAAAAAGPVAAWGQVVGGAGQDTAGAVAVDAAGATYVTGTFTGTARFGPAPADTLTSRGGRDVYLAAYAPDGTLRWARRAGTGYDDNAAGVVVSPGGQVVLTGSSFGGARLDSPGGELALVGRGGWDGFVARFDAAGTVQWAQGIGGPGTDQVQAVTVDRWSRITVVGSFTRTATFGSGPGAPSLGAVALEDAYVASFGPDGSTRWARTLAGGGSQDLGAGVLAHDGALYAAATFEGAAVVGGEQLYATTLTSSAAVVARLDPVDGHVRWIDLARATSPGSGYVIPAALRGAPGGDVLAVGLVRGQISLGPAGSAPTHQLAAAGGTDGFVWRLGPGGATRWTATVGGTADDAIRDATTSAAGQILVGGSVTGTASVGSGPGAPTLTAGPGVAGFLARFGADGSPISGEVVVGDSSTGAPSVVVAGLASATDASTRVTVRADRPVTAAGATYPTGEGGSSDALVLRLG